MTVTISTPSSPLLYEVGAAELEPEEIAHPVRSILRHATNARFWLETIEQVNLAAKTVRTTELFPSAA